MLLEFKMKNFKSFRQEMSFTMVPAQIKDLEYSIITKKVKEKDIRALSSAVIYGPNSSGKTNIIGAMDVLRAIVLRGNIMDDENITTPNIAANRLNLIPNVESKEDEPVTFYIKFVSQEILVEYSLSIELGAFWDSKHERKVINEELHVDGCELYKRTEKGVIIGKTNAIKKYLVEDISRDIIVKLVKTNLDEKDLFLNGLFKTLYSKEIYDIIINWFRDKFKIVYRADKIHVSPNISIENKEKKFISDIKLNEAVKNFGLTSTQIVFPTNREKQSTIPLSVIDVKCKKNKAIIPAEAFESFGTIRFLNMFPIISKALHKGYTLVVDELDASIHPMAIMNIINIFHNDEINKNGAQLIFNTHNPIFLNNSLLRRDEIKFVEKEEDGSIHYSLSDFGTNGPNGVRNTEDYMKNYFINKYGAIENVDFSDILMNESGDEDK